MVKKTIPKKVKKVIDDYLEGLKKDNLPLQSVFLFGSYAAGSQHKWSDVDLCVISPRFKDSWQATEYLWKMRTKDYGLTIEPVGIAPKDFKEGGILIDEIKRTGVRVV